MRYCGRRCQVAAWPEHRDACPQLRVMREQVYRHEIGTVLSEQPGAYPPETPGFLMYVFPPAFRGRIGFMRRTSDAETVRLVEGAGMQMWQRREWHEFVGDYAQELGDLYDLVFARRGMLRAAAHAPSAEQEGQAGIPMVVASSMSIHLSPRRHLRVCMLAASMGLGLITGHRRGGRRAPPALFLHGWDVLTGDGVPSQYRREIILVALAPLLPRSLRQAL